MKQFTKKIALALLVLIGSTFIFSDLSIANAEVTDTNETVVATALPSDDNSAIAPCADVIGWRYKTREMDWKLGTSTLNPMYNINPPENCKSYSSLGDFLLFIIMI